DSSASRNHASLRVRCCYVATCPRGAWCSFRSCGASMNERSESFRGRGMLRGKVAVVTGASRGLGKGIASVLGEAGAVVYITARSVRATSRLKDFPGTKAIRLIAALVMSWKSNPTGFPRCRRGEPSLTAKRLRMPRSCANEIPDADRSRCSRLRDRYPDGNRLRHIQLRDACRAHRHDEPRPRSGGSRCGGHRNRNRLPQAIRGCTEASSMSGGGDSKGPT